MANRNFREVMKDVLTGLKQMLNEKELTRALIGGAD